jgi:hypothetical protein
MSGAEGKSPFLGTPPLPMGGGLSPGEVGRRENVAYDNHLTQCGRAHDCQAKGRRFKSRHRRFFNLQPYFLAVVGFVGTWGGILGKE